MVFYFTSNVVDPPVTLFMGLDKFENEHLIKVSAILCVDPIVIRKIRMFLGLPDPLLSGTDPAPDPNPFVFS
jgi:hypothetical protein